MMHDERGRFRGRTALITGASQGIGQAMAKAFAAQDAQVVLMGRSEDSLVESLPGGSAGHRLVVADIESRESLTDLTTTLLVEGLPIDLVVHCAGQYARGELDEAEPEELDHQYSLSARGPLLLTKLLLPLLRRRPSDLVFIGSPVTPRAGLGAFAAGQAAQQVLIHTLRAELAHEDIRILCVLPGRTATPRQEAIFAMEGRSEEYSPERLLQPEDVAACTLDALSLPRRAEVTEIWLRPAEATY